MLGVGGQGGRKGISTVAGTLLSPPGMRKASQDARTGEEEVCGWDKRQSRAKLKGAVISAG